jgi:SH3 domain protein
MRRMLVNTAVLACALVIIPLCLQARSMYVRDWITVSVRAAPYEASQTVAHANTNDMVEVLEEGDGWTRVKTEKGIEGWVQSRYLTPQPPRTLVTRRLEERLKALQEENARLRGLKPSDQYSAGPAAQKAAQPGAGAPIDTVLPDCPELQKNYERLVKDLKIRSERIDLLMKENTSLKTSERLLFTLIGGAFIALGIIVGLFLQAVRSHPKKPGYRF